MATEPSRSGSGRRLSADDWARAALEVIAERGITGVAVEPLAARLGATKGSFYWHFANRRALIEAALTLWAREHTEQVIADVEEQPDPATRLRELLTVVVESVGYDRIEVALLASADDPLVAAAVGRVTQRRIDYVASLYEQLGKPREEAAALAVLAVSVYLGHVQLAHAAPDSLPRSRAAWRRYLDHLNARLLD